ncbi:MAG: hypothetical protein ACREYC_10395 [Gammaproteobacteria bacterium]
MTSTFRAGRRVNRGYVLALLDREVLPRDVIQQPPKERGCFLG